MASEDQEFEMQLNADLDEDGATMNPISIFNNDVTGNQPPKETAFHEDRTERKRSSSHRVSFLGSDNLSDDCEERQDSRNVVEAPNLDPPPESKDLSHAQSKPNLRAGGPAGESDKESNAIPRPRTSSIVSRVFREVQIMDEHNSYHQDISAEEAEERLKKCGSHCYLTRYSSSNQCYVLTVYKKGLTYQMKQFPIIFFNRGGEKIYQIKGKERQFRSLEEMLQHYQQNRIDPGLKSIGRCVTEDEYRTKKKHKCQIS